MHPNHHTVEKALQPMSIYSLRGTYNLHHHFIWSFFPFSQLGLQALVKVTIYKLHDEKDHTVIEDSKEVSHMMKSNHIFKGKVPQNYLVRKKM